MSKIKVLFVVGSLYRAGAERFAYEVDKTLNKEMFETSILCLENENEIPKQWVARYYDKKHLALGTSIVYTDRFRNQVSNKKKGLLARVFRRIFPNKKPFWKESLYKYLDGFDVIHWMGEYTYIHSVSKSIHDKSLIHMMSSRFQDEHLYSAFDHDQFHRFCTPFKDNEISFELYQFKNYDYLHIPLVLDLRGASRNWKYPKDQIKKIGIFTRLNSYKPLDPFFYAFQVLLDRIPDAELHIFGTGNPEIEGMYKYLDRLGLRDKVYFRGHQEDIVETAIKEKLSLSWFQGYNNDRPAGYAGIDICTTGVPLICWDFHQKPINGFNETFPHYKNINQFVEKTVEIMMNESVADELSKKQFDDTVKTRNVDSYIPLLEQEYLKIANVKI